MRILLTADTVGGVWDFTCTLARGAVEAGHEVLVAVLGEPDSRRHRPPAGVETVSRPYRLEWMPDSVRDVAASTSWLAEMARLWLADVVHLNQYAPALGDYESPVVVTAHSDVLSWFSESLGAPAPAEWNQYADRVRSALPAADAVVAPTSYQSSLLARHYGREADLVIHNGTVPPVPPDDPGNTPRELIAVCAARAWDSAKGVSTFDRAAGLAGEPRRRMHLLGATDSPGGERLTISHLQAHGPLPREEVDRWFSRAAIYAAPSLYEPFGLAILEAARAGCALVLGNIDSLREVWGEAAVYVDPDNPQQLRDAINELIENPDHRKQLSALAWHKSQAYFAEQMACEYLNAYESLANHAAFSHHNSATSLSGLHL